MILIPIGLACILLAAATGTLLAVRAYVRANPDYRHGDPLPHVPADAPLRTWWDNRPAKTSRDHAQAR